MTAGDWGYDPGSSTCLMCKRLWVRCLALQKSKKEKQRGWELIQIIQPQPSINNLFPKARVSRY